MRSQEDIAAAHDRLSAIVLGEVPTPPEMVKAPIVAALDVLCWVLNHDHNQTFQTNLGRIDSFLASRGLMLTRIPEAQPALSPIEEKLLDALRFIRDLTEEALGYARIGTGEEVALRHAFRRATEAIQNAESR